MQLLKIIEKILKVSISYLDFLFIKYSFLIHLKYIEQLVAYFLSIIFLPKIKKI